MNFGKVFLDSSLKTHVKGVAYDCVTDGYLVCPRNVSDVIFKVLKIQVMACVKSESAVPCCFCSLDERCDCLSRVVSEPACICLGVKLYAVASA